MGRFFGFGAAKFWGLLDAAAARLASLVFTVVLSIGGVAAPSLANQSVPPPGSAGADACQLQAILQAAQGIQSHQTVAGGATAAGGGGLAVPLSASHPIRHQTLAVDAQRRTIRTPAGEFSNSGPGQFVSFENRFETGNPRRPARIVDIRVDGDGTLRVTVQDIDGARTRGLTLPEIETLRINEAAKNEFLRLHPDFQLQPHPTVRLSVLGDEIITPQGRLRRDGDGQFISYEAADGTRRPAQITGFSFDRNGRLHMQVLDLDTNLPAELSEPQILTAQHFEPARQLHQRLEILQAHAMRTGHHIAAQRPVPPLHVPAAAAVAPPAGVIRHRGVVQPCCTGTQGVLRHMSQARRLVAGVFDFYFTAGGVGDVPPWPEGYQYDAPTSVQGRPLQMSHYQIDDLPDAERVAQVVGSGASQSTTYVANGVQSSVFFRHLERPVGSILSAMEWAMQQAQSVIKVRTSDPWDFGFPEAVHQIRRDLGLYDVAEQLSSRATLNGRRFVRPARLLSGDDLHAIGILEQEVVRGPRLDSLQVALDVLNPRTASQRQALIAAHRRTASQYASMTPEAARTLLASAGLDPANPAQLRQMQRRIHALEQFYRDAHPDVTAFANANHLRQPGDRLRNDSSNDANGKGIVVGFDYNHGSNVHWDPVEQMFVMVDW